MVVVVAVPGAAGAEATAGLLVEALIGRPGGTDRGTRFAGSAEAANHPSTGGFLATAAR